MVTINATSAHIWAMSVRTMFAHCSKCQLAAIILAIVVTMIGAVDQTRADAITLRCERIYDGTWTIDLVQRTVIANSDSGGSSQSFPARITPEEVSWSSYSNTCCIGRKCDYRCGSSWTVNRYNMTIVRVFLAADKGPETFTPAPCVRAQPPRPQF